MKKHGLLKRVFSIALVLVVMLSLFLPAEAASTGPISISHDLTKSIVYSNLNSLGVTFEGSDDQSYLALLDDTLWDLVEEFWQLVKDGSYIIGTAWTFVETTVEEWILNRSTIDLFGRPIQDIHVSRFFAEFLKWLRSNKNQDSMGNTILYSESSGITYRGVPTAFDHFITASISGTGEVYRSSDPTIRASSTYHDTALYFDSGWAYNYYYIINNSQTQPYLRHDKGIINTAYGGYSWNFGNGDLDHSTLDSDYFYIDLLLNPLIPDKVFLAFTTSGGLTTVYLFTDLSNLTIGNGVSVTVNIPDIYDSSSDIQALIGGFAQNRNINGIYADLHHIRNRNLDQLVEDGEPVIQLVPDDPLDPRYTIPGIEKINDILDDLDISIDVIVEAEEDGGHDEILRDLYDLLLLLIAALPKSIEPDVNIDIPDADITIPTDIIDPDNPIIIAGLFTGVWKYVSTVYTSAQDGIDLIFDAVNAFVPVQILYLVYAGIVLAMMFGVLKIFIR